MKSNLVLNPGEVLCDECNGEGFKTKENNTPDAAFTHINITCEKCYGEGKLDWIEVVVGKRKPIPEYVSFDLRSTMNFSEEYLCSFDSDDNLMKEMAKKLAIDIDKDILEVITKQSKDKIWTTKLF